VPLVNQHSFLIIAAVVLAAGWLALRRTGRWLRWPALAATAALALGFFSLMRTGPGDVRSAADVDRALASGKPVALELFSNY
jgi:hypothetical protein